jgi:hypothetical protein
MMRTPSSASGRTAMPYSLAEAAFLAKHQISEKELRTCYGHDLDRLYNKAIEVGLHRSVSEAKKSEALSPVSSHSSIVCTALATYGLPPAVT